MEATALAELGAVVLVEVADLRALQPRAPTRLEPALTERAADALRIRSSECEHRTEPIAQRLWKLESNARLQLEYTWTHQ